MLQEVIIVILTGVLQWSAAKPDLCYDGVKSYTPGDSFISSDCTGSCSCHAGGIIQCVSLCPPTRALCKKDEKKIQTSRKLANSNCTCPQWQCVKIINKEFCFDGGRRFKPGKSFISTDCSSSCKCWPGGSVSCVSLCPPERIRCAEDEERIQTSRKVASSNCTCPQWQCVKRKQRDVCIDGANVYNPGDNFTSSDCTTHCICHSGARVSCTPLCSTQDITCGPGESKQEWSEQISNSKCTCRRWKCVKKLEEFCNFYGERHKVGEKFISKDCNGYCWCTGSLGFACVSLCPPRGIYCRPGTRKVRTTTPAFTGTNCTCPSWKCVKVESKWQSWSNWTKCDAICGGGLRYRYRTCAENAICFGPSVEAEVCNSASCSPSYTDAPCGAQRMNSARGDIWPRCDDQGYFEPLQCDSSTSTCWCSDKWGNVQPGSRRLSHKPQCTF